MKKSKIYYFKNVITEGEELYRFIKKTTNTTLKKFKLLLRIENCIILY